jgi:hypothetical protein
MKNMCSRNEIKLLALLDYIIKATTCELSVSLVFNATHSQLRLRPASVIAV